MIAEELIVLKNKMDEFAREFNEAYEKKLANFEGYISSDWEKVSELVEKYFERKYFELLHSQK